MGRLFAALTMLWITVGPGAVSAANIGAPSNAMLQTFNDSPAANTRACQAMISLGNALAAMPRHFFDRIDTAKMANAAKLCAFNARGTAAERLPTLMNTAACGALKAHFAEVEKVVRAETSWACGWPSPVRNFRPVPGFASEITDQ